MYASQCAIRLSVAFRLVRSDLGLIRFAIGVRLLIELTSQTSRINPSSELSINLSYWIPLYHRLFEYHSHTSTIILIFDRCTQPLSRVVIKWFRRNRSSFFLEKRRFDFFSEWEIGDWLWWFVYSIGICICIRILIREIVIFWEAPLLCRQREITLESTQRLHHHHRPLQRMSNGLSISIMQWVNWIKGPEIWKIYVHRCINEIQLNHRNQNHIMEKREKKLIYGYSLWNNIFQS